MPHGTDNPGSIGATIPKGDIMSSNSHPEQADDPRAQWRRLPAEPAYYVEETDVDASSSSYSVPAVDPAQDFVRLYGA